MVNHIVMKKVLFFVVYLCLFLLTSITLIAIHSSVGGGSYSKGIVFDCWSQSVDEIKWEWYNLRGTSPYWGTPFYSTDSRLTAPVLVENLPNGGARYTAVWNESEDNAYPVDYYQDKNGRCLPDCSACATGRFNDCSCWYTKSEDGLVVPDIPFAIVFFCYVFTLFALPLIVWLFTLYKIICYIKLFVRTRRHTIR